MLRQRIKRSFTQRSICWSLLAFMIPVLVCSGICILDEVYPFGTNCILHVDMYHQYCPFFTEFMNKLKSGDNLMYSWHIGLGSDFISVFVYYLASPLNWLILFCPSNRVIEFMTILIIFKIGFAGFAFYKFCEYHFELRGRKGIRRQDALMAAAFSSAYALSGFIAAYSWDIMWLDSIALAPLIFMGLEKLMEEEKPAMYYITLALSILCNYYISIMICIFLVFYFALHFLEMRPDTPGKRWRSLGRFTIYSLLAGGTGLVLMLPEMIVLGYSGSSGIDFPETVEWYFDILSEITRMSTGASVYTGNNHWPNLYAGAFAVLFVFLYLLNGEITLLKKLPRVGMVIFFLLSFANNWLDFIWHGFHFPDSLPARESFLFIFLVLILGYEAYLHLDGQKIWQISLAILISEGILYAGLKVTDTSVTESDAVYLTIAFIAAYAAIVLVLKTTEGEKRLIIRMALAAVMVAELSYNMYLTGFSTTSRTAYTEKSATYEALLNLAQKDACNYVGADSPDQVFFRVEDTERLTKNDDARYGYASATQFSSLMNINVSHFFQSVYMEGGKNFYCYNGATPLTSAMLSVGYFLSDSPYEESALKTYVGDANGIYLYRNNYCLPLGYVIPENCVDQWESTSHSKLSGINELAAAMGASTNLLESVECDIYAVSGETTITFPENGYYYAHYQDCSADTLTFNYDNGKTTTWSKTTHSYLFDLGYDTAGSQVTITNSKSDMVTFMVYRLNMDALNEAYDNLSQQTMEMDSCTSTDIKGHITITNAGRLVFPIAGESGWTLYVNGEKTDFVNFSDTFISVSLDPGNYEIELKYRTPGLYEGAAASGACLLLFLVLMGIRRRRKTWKNL